MFRATRTRACEEGTTLKPMMIAFDACASVTSLSEMPPTPLRITLILTSDWSSLAS
jgi:hypothetical protein